jgi:EAL domain-containing protein (putative c-di-GMP-specific phosphodiesterase class I)
LPIDILKIDQSFIADIDHVITGGAVVEAVTNLAHALGLAVTAEGVETQRQADEIKAIGCDSSQGFFYALPMVAAAFHSQLGALEANQMYLPATVETLLPPGEVISSAPLDHR